MFKETEKSGIIFKYPKINTLHGIVTLTILGGYHG